MRKILFIIILVFMCVFPGAVFGEDDSNSALYFWRLINEARANPMETIHKLDIDESTAREALGEDAWVLDSGLPPLAWNTILVHAASDHNNDMITNLYYSSTGLDGSTVSDRIGETGYTALSSGEILGALAFLNFVEPLEAATVIFDNWVRYELDPSRDEKMSIFNKDLTEIGISFMGATLDLGEDIPPNVYVAVADLARPAEQRAYILGNVYRDINGNMRFDPGEGAPGMKMIVKGYLPGHDSRLISQVLGVYQFEIPQVFFTFEVLDDSGTVIAKRAGFGDDVNQIVDFRIQ